MTLVTAEFVGQAFLPTLIVPTVKHCKSPRLLGLALLPAIFAMHSFTSAFVWHGLLGGVPPIVLNAATGFYLFVAFVLLPMYAPTAVLLVEPRGWRRIVFVLLIATGAYAGLSFLLALIEGRGSAVACDFYISFNIDSTATSVAVLYILAACGALLLSGQRILEYWGIVNALAVGALAFWASRGLSSLWCFLAACSSVFIAWYLRHLDAAHLSGKPWPWESPASDEVRKVETRL
ncbi:MAG: hypothetical protein Q7L55_11685 [Actinomycetota bacterium]|nr:hypothetical protein [Actinomycetota bacterium]